MDLKLVRRELSDNILKNPGVGYIEAVYEIPDLNNSRVVVEYSGKGINERRLKSLTVFVDIMLFKNLPVEDLDLEICARFSLKRIDEENASINILRENAIRGTGLTVAWFTFRKRSNTKDFFEVRYDKNGTVTEVSRNNQCWSDAENAQNIKELSALLNLTDGRETVIDLVTKVMANPKLQALLQDILNAVAYQLYIIEEWL